MNVQKSILNTGDNAIGQVGLECIRNKLTYFFRNSTIRKFGFNLNDLIVYMRTKLFDLVRISTVIYLIKTIAEYY